MYTYTPPFLISFPFRPPQSFEQGSLCYTVDSHQLFLLCTVVNVQSQEQIQKWWHINTMEYYTATKGNKSEPLPGHGWVFISSGSDIQSKEKNTYCLLMSIYEVQKNGNDEPIWQARIERQTQRMHFCTLLEEQLLLQLLSLV